MKSQQQGNKEFNRVLRDVFLEIDRDKFKFIGEIKDMTAGNNELTQGHFMQIMSRKLEGPSQKQLEERITRWLKMLEQCGLIKKERNTIRLIYQNLEQAETNLDCQTKSSMFKQFLFEAYLSMSDKAAGIVDIVDLREYVALSLYREKKGALTESRFDELLRLLPMVTDDYVISLGHPMGAEEKLFVYEADYYRTLSITFFKEGAKHG